MVQESAIQSKIVNGKRLHQGASETQQVPLYQLVYVYLVKIFNKISL